MSHSSEKDRRGTPLCRVSSTKNFMNKMEGEEVVSRFSVKNFLSLSADDFCGGTLQCVTNFGYRKVFCSRG